VVSGDLRERDQVEVAGSGLVLISLLGTAPTSRTWLAAGAGDSLHVARRVGARSEADRRRLLTGLTRLTRLRHPALLSPDRAWPREAAIWFTRPHLDGVSLRRLAAVARLDPRHIAALGDDVLVGLMTLHASGATHGALHPGNILVGLDGRARLADMGLAVAPGGDPGRIRLDRPPSPRGVRSHRGARVDLEAAAASLRGALAPVRRPGSGAADELRLRGPLDALLLAPGPVFAGADSAEAARAELLKLAGEQDARVRREIAALVPPLREPRPLASPALAGGAALPAPGPPVALPPLPLSRAGPAPEAPRARREPIPPLTVPLGRSGPPELPPARRERAPQPPPASPRGRLSRRTLAMWLVPLAAIALIVAAVVVLMGKGHPEAGLGPARSSPALSPASSPSLSPSAPQPATPSASASPPRSSAPPRPSAPAPATAGTVSGLSISPMGGCTAVAGGSCEVRVAVDLEPQPAPTTVAFDLLLVDSCTGASSTLPGGSVTAGSEFDMVWSDTPVNFANGDPATLYAVTSAPARAASPGLALPGSAPAC